MRARNIKPGFFKNDLLAECHPLARILFEGLWCMADREGLLKDRPQRIKAEILPYDILDGKQNPTINELLNELAQKKDCDGSLAFITRYQVNGTAYIQVIHFKENQHPHVNEKQSEIPKPENSGTSTVQVPNRSGTNPSDSLITDYLITDKEITAKSTAKKPLKSKKAGAASAFFQKNGKKAEPPEPFYLTKKKKKLDGWKLETFELFWKIFHWPKDKANASDAQLQIPGLTKELAIKQIIPAAARYCAARPAIIANNHTPKWAQGWLSSRRWEDEKFEDEKDGLDDFLRRHGKV